jgi:CBS domain containing-hemolysin-like protein
VLQREILSAVARGTSTSTPLRDFLRPANHIPEWEPIGNLLRRLIENREHLALATDEYGGISGLVTQEDLVETLLGIEIVDEYDRVEDLQAEARRLRDLRLRQLGETQPPPD